MTGFGGLAEAVRGSDRPVGGLGGLTPDDSAEVRRSGARGLAVLSGVFGAERVGDATRAYLVAWEQGA